MTLSYLKNYNIGLLTLLIILTIVIGGSFLPLSSFANMTTHQLNTFCKHQFSLSPEKAKVFAKRQEENLRKQLVKKLTDSRQQVNHFYNDLFTVMYQYHGKKSLDETTRLKRCHDVMAVFDKYKIHSISPSH